MPCITADHFCACGRACRNLLLAGDETLAVCVTGDNAGALLERCPVLSELGEIPAIVEGVRRLVPQAGSIIEIGSQGARFIAEVQSRTPQFAANEHCAGGTGSFFEDQMSRVGCKLEDYSALVEQAQSIPRLSGRCAVFAKTDIIHRQQEGVSTPDILLGLCYAMIHNYKATIVRRLPVCKPVVFCGGVTCNSGVIRAIRDVFDLTEEELIVPEEARFEAAIGAACKAEGAFTLAQLDALLNNAMTAHSTTTGLPRLELLPGTDLSEPKATGVLPEKGCALGIDIGSTTVKVVVLDEQNKLLFRSYERHFSKVREKACEILNSIAPRFSGQDIKLVITGSAGLGVAKASGIDFVQEVYATAAAVNEYIPDTDAVIELGGEDAKIIYFDNGIEQRMNGTCAGGTGAFIDQMASLLHTDAGGLNELAKRATTIHPIASRCGVFAKTDVQPLLNEGADPADVAASIFQSVVTQTISGLACGRPIRGHVAFLGGPLQYLSELRHRFRVTLELDDEHMICPQNAHLFVASGAALAAVSGKRSTLPQLVQDLDNLGDVQGSEVQRLAPLFPTPADRAEFDARHASQSVPRATLRATAAACHRHRRRVHQPLNGRRSSASRASCCAPGTPPTAATCSAPPACSWTTSTVHCPRAAPWAT